MSDSSQARFINPPNALRAKVTVGGPGAVSPEVLEKAEDVIAGMADDYVTWAQEDIGRISAALEDLCNAPPEGQGQALVRIYQISHDMKGQGGSFQYQLMTILGDLLCRYVEGRESATEADLAVIRLHIDAMQVVIAKQMTGDGGADGAKLLKGLELVVAKRRR